MYVNDTQPAPSLLRFTELTGMLSFLRELIKDKSTYYRVLFGVEGDVSCPSSDGRRYFVHPNGKPFPLFDPIEKIEIDRTYSMGDDENELSSVHARQIQSAPQTPRSQSYFMEEDDIDEEEDPEMADDDFASL